MRTPTTIILILFSGILLHAQSNDTVQTGSLGPARHGFFGDFSMGVSNYGMAGGIKVYYRAGAKYFSAGYYRSHLCYAGESDGIPFWSSGTTTHHVSIKSYTAAFGHMLPTRLAQGISAGISISRITAENTDPIRNDFSLGGVYREIFGGGFEDHSHGPATRIVIRIPIEYTVFLFQKGPIGLDMAARVDLNTTRIFTAITLGVRIGK